VSCFATTQVIAQQLWQWVLGLIAYLTSVCTAVAQIIQSWQQTWQNVCNQVTSTVQQWQTQLQNQCTQVTSQVCNSLPWPLSALCSWVTSVVCTVISVLVLVVVVIVQTVCTLVSALILVLSLIVQIICMVIMLVVDVLLLVVYLVLVLLIYVVCILLPCRSPMGSPVPPDGGWAVTLGQATPPLLSANNQVTVLPDGELACRRMIQAIRQARSTIHLIQLEFDTDFITTFAGVVPRTTLVCALLDAAQRGAKVRLMMNDNAFADSLPKLTAAFGSNPMIEMAGLKIQPLQHLGMLHAKGMFIDSAVAFVDGLPFTQGYWDTQSHFVTDIRRGSGAGGNATGLGNVGNGVGNKPAHTVSLQIVGPAATSIDATFVSLWNSVSSDQVVVPPPPAGTGQQSVQIVRTAPALNTVGLSNEKGVLEAHLRAINNAMSFIYIEVQYLTNPVIGAALVRALSSRPGLQLILLLNENPDMPTYKFWQNQLLTSLAPFAQQVGVFTLWRTAPGNATPPPEIMQCYVEAKAGVVDDAWACVGSANLDGASLDHIFEFLPSPLLCVSAGKGWRNVELSAVLYDGIAGQPATGQVAQLRQVLWQEHLGIAALPVAPPPGGWLGLWNATATANLAALNASQAMPGGPTMPSRILPYAAALQAAAQLSQLGVDTNVMDVAPVVPPAVPDTLVAPPCPQQDQQ
jgi:phosphatidylserine/phosphatidylglycerophosphate/cardiolipin synthase-like enzyme